MEPKKKYIADLMLLLTAAIWGLGFYFQKVASETTSPFCFNGMRYLIAALVISIFARFRLPLRGEERRCTLVAGSVLFIAGTLQQIGLRTASIGNSSFITAVYIVLVPFFSALILKRKISPSNYLAALLALAGLYLISTSGKGLSRISRGDMILFTGSIFWALHILAVEKGVSVCDPVVFSAGQFLTAGILHLLAWLTLGHADLSGLPQSWPYAAASGIFVLGLAFTLQAVAQKNTGETEASILLGMESVFGALFGAVLYNEQFSAIQAAGMGLIFAAILIVVLKK